MNQLRGAFRKIAHERFTTYINIFGLTLGLVSSLGLWLWISGELSYNKNFDDVEEIYLLRVDNGDDILENTSSLLTSAIETNIPEVEFAAKITSWSERLVLRVGEISSKEEGAYASKDFFRIFDFKVLAGDLNASLVNPNTIVISRSLAEKFFRNENAINKTIRVNDKNLVVGAVFDEASRKSTFCFAWIMGSKSIEESWMNDWNNKPFCTYIKLRDNSSTQNVKKKVAGLIQSEMPALKEVLVMQAFEEIYLYNDFSNRDQPGGRIHYVRVFSFIGLLVLIVACINFTNLVTARVTIRNKEIAVRKLLGASRIRLVVGLLLESTLICSISTVLALCILWGLLPTIEAAVNREMVTSIFEYRFWVGAVSIVVLTSVMSGVYPALLLSIASPKSILSDNSPIFVRGSILRKGLVIFQFSLSIVFIYCIFATKMQLDYIKYKNLGLDRENLIYVLIEGQMRSKVSAFTSDLMNTSTAKDVAVSSEIPVHIGTSSTESVSWSGKTIDKDQVVFSLKVGKNFFKTLGIEFIEGMDFSSDADSSSYIINESAAKLIGSKNIVGQELYHYKKKGRIVGVVKDFHFNSLKSKIQPLIISLRPEQANYFIVRTQKGMLSKTVTEIERINKELNPGQPIEYGFLKDEYDRLYTDDKLLNKAINYFGILAISISCLGLFGLITFTAQQRTKEVGIRKVLGATEFNIVTLLTKDYIILILSALVLSLPISMWIVKKWLENFAYKVTIPSLIYVLSSSIAILVALITISAQTLKTARQNPLKSINRQ